MQVDWVLGDDLTLRKGRQAVAFSGAQAPGVALAILGCLGPEDRLRTLMTLPEVAALVEAAEAIQGAFVTVEAVRAALAPWRQAKEAPCSDG